MIHLSYFRGFLKNFIILLFISSGLLAQTLTITESVPPSPNPAKTYITTTFKSTIDSGGLSSNTANAVVKVSFSKDVYLNANNDVLNTGLNGFTCDKFTGNEEHIPAYNFITCTNASINKNQTFDFQFDILPTADGQLYQFVSLNSDDTDEYSHISFVDVIYSAGTYLSSNTLLAESPIGTVIGTFSTYNDDGDKQANVVYTLNNFTTEFEIIDDKLVSKIPIAFDRWTPPEATLDITNDKITTVTATPTIKILKNFDDMCYESVITSPLPSTKKTVPINNISGVDLSNVSILYDTTNGGSMADNCEITPSGTCSTPSTNTTFTFGADITPGQTDASISATSDFDEVNLFASYTKYGSSYNKKLNPCQLTIGFTKQEWQIKEDVFDVNGNPVPDGQAKVMEITVHLSTPVSYDVSVGYSTRDALATAGEDFSMVSGTLTILANETTASIFLNIYHNTRVEFDEDFYIDLFNQTPSNTVEIAINPAHITILEQTEFPTCYADDFSTTLDSKWRTLFSSGGFTPQIVDSRLRLTPGWNDVATAVTKDYEFISDGNIIIAEFEHYAYGGCEAGQAHDSGTYGADGIVLVLYDSAVGADPAVGAWGGSMGYAQKTGIDGFEGGWLGLGIDEYGNFGNCNTDKYNGIQFNADGTVNHDVEGCTSFNAQSHTNFASIRGEGNGTVGYKFLASTDQLSPPVANKSATSAAFGHKYRFTADSRDSAKLLITLERDVNTGLGYQVIINQFDARLQGQSSTPEYIRFALTSGTGWGCNNHEIDELAVRGVCRAYNPNPPDSVASTADIVDRFTSANDYNVGQNKYITTKVSGKTETIAGVHLGAGNQATPFLSSNLKLTFRIIPYLVDLAGTRHILLDTAGNPAVISISSNNYAAELDVVMPTWASKDSQFYITALDFSEVYANHPDQCLLNSSLTGNLQGLGQCVNATDTKYKDTFGEDTYQRCAVANGAPCLSNNHGVGTGDYANSYGCLMCTLDANASMSTDHFAIRPDRFEFTTTDPNVLFIKSGEDVVKHTLNAKDFGTTVNTINYTITDNAAGFDTHATTRNSTGAIDNTLHGSSSITKDFNTIDGVSTDGATTEVVGVSFDDVGRVSVSVQDRTWSNVDLTDQYWYNDPSNTQHNNCDPDGAYICGELNATFIPHHFSFVDTNITNNNGDPGSFTYLNNLVSADATTYAMGVRVKTKIEARNQANIITQNFKEGAGYYENPLSLSMVFTRASAPVNATTTTVPAQALGFGGTNAAGGDDANGTKTMMWNEVVTDVATNKTLRLNFPRAIDVPQNPFTVSGADLNITASSLYNGGAIDITSDNSGGVGNADGNVTMLYARTGSRKTRIICDKDNMPCSSGGTEPDVLIYYEAYCYNHPGRIRDCNATLLPIGSGRVTDSRWYVNVMHDDGTSGGTKMDGNLANSVHTTAPGKVTVNVMHNKNIFTKDSVHTFTGTFNELPYEAYMDDTVSPWLLNNDDGNAAAATNKHLVIFKPETEWSGERESNSTTETQRVRRVNRRTMW